MSYTIPDRAQINRNNSRHATGPRRRSCLTAFRHGFTGQLVLMPAEDLEAYQTHIQCFVNEYQPQGATEAQLVQALGDAAWRINRVAVLETNLLTYDIVYEDFPNNESTHEMREAMAISDRLDSHARALSTLSLHGQRLSRQFEKTLALLQKLQSTRQANQPREFKQPEPHPPLQCDGFVFSNDEKPVGSDRRAAPVTAGNSALISNGFAKAGAVSGHSSEKPDDPSRPVDVN